MISSTSKFSRNKAVGKTIEGSTPVWLLMGINYFNTKFNWGLDQETINSVGIVLTAGYFYIKNWLKNRG